VAAKSCHDSDTQGTTCVVTLDYTAPDGTPGEVVFHGVEATRIHNQSGHETVYIYFSDSSSETAVNPQDNVPLWATVLLVTVSVPVAIWGVVYIWLGFRRPQAVHRRLDSAPAPFDQDLIT
jgi:hypothetical protein